MKTLIRSLVGLCLVLASYYAHSQTLSDVVKGDKLFDKFDYDGALYYYELVNAAMPHDASVTRKIADTYRRMGNNNMAAEWYKKTLQIDASNPDDMMHYAETLRSLGEYDEAVAWYGEYAKFRPDDKRAQSHLKQKEYYVDLQSDSLKYVIKRLEINNSDPAIGMCRYENGKFLISSMRLDKINGMDNPNWAKELPFLDVYVCDLNEKEELVNASRLDKNVNSKYHDGPMFYSKVDKNLYITRNNMRGGRPERDKNGNINLQIYTSKNDEGGWKSAQEVKIGDADYSYGHPCLTKDGNFLYYASNMPGGYGGTDIYVSQRTPDGWTEPVNLGPGVNSEGNEMFPFMTDNGVLYFSSDGWAGLGGLDIFRSDFIFGKWMDAVNLGYPVNSSSDDFSILYDNIDDSGFFFSSRTGLGNDDAYSFHTIKLIQMIVAGTVHSDVPGHSLAGEKILIKSLASGNTTTETLNDKEQFKFEAEAGDKIEIRMMNPMLETKDPVFTYDVPQPIIDPYQDMGERTIVPEKIDMLTAYLNSKAEKQTLIAKYRLTNVPEEAQPLSGTVIDKITLEPLVNTEVVATAADGQQYTGYTDDKGVFTLLVPVKAGIMNITAKGENFVPKTIQVDTEVTQHDVTHVEMQLVYTDAYINKLKKEGWEDVSGVVNDATSKKGVDGARVSATTPDGKVYVTETDETGKFMLMVPGRNIEKIDINHKNYNTSLVALPAANNGTLPDNLKVTLDRTVVYAEQIHQDYLDKNGVNINGVLIDAEDGMPLMDATVTATDKDGHFYAATTDDNGNWTMRVPQGAEMKITAEKKDYSMVTIQAITPKGKGKMNGDTKIAMKHTAEYKAMIEAQASEMGYDKVELSGLVVDMTTGNAMPNANITLKFTNGEEMTYMTDADGRFTIVVTKDEHMTFTVSKDDYLSQTIEMNTKASSSSLMNDMKVKLPHTPEYLAEHGGMIDPEEGKKSPGFENLVDLEALDIQNVLFDYDKAFIREDSKPILDQVARIMKEQPSFNLVVRTHCDARGSIAYNQQLSMSRAMAVKGYLMQKGINKNRVKTEWFGEAKPLNHCVDENSNCSEQEFELNRRAEFKLVSDSFSQSVNH